MTRPPPRSTRTDTLLPSTTLFRSGRYRLRLADAKVLTDALGVETAGPATVEGTLAGAFDALALSGHATLQRLAVADQRLDDLSGRYDLRLSGSDIDGPIEEIGRAKVWTPVTNAHPVGRLRLGQKK